MTAYRRVYDSRHLQADCQEPGSAPDMLGNRVWATFNFFHSGPRGACHILKLKCTKFDFGWGSAPGPAGGAYSAPPDPLAVFKWAYF